MEDRADGRAECQRGGYHLVSRTNPKRGKRKMQPGRARVDCQSVLRPEVVSEFVLKLGGFRPRRDPSGAKYGCDLINLFLADGEKIIGNEAALIHGQSGPPIPRRSVSGLW